MEHVIKPVVRGWGRGAAGGRGPKCMSLAGDWWRGAWPAPPPLPLACPPLPRCPHTRRPPGARQVPGRQDHLPPQPQRPLRDRRPARRRRPHRCAAAWGAAVCWKACAAAGRLELHHASLLPLHALERSPACTAPAQPQPFPIPPRRPQDHHRHLRRLGRARRRCLLRQGARQRARTRSSAWRKHASAAAGLCCPHTPACSGSPPPLLPPCNTRRTPPRWTAPAPTSRARPPSRSWPPSSPAAAWCRCAPGAGCCCTLSFAGCLPTHGSLAGSLGRKHSNRVKENSRGCQPRPPCLASHHRRTSLGTAPAAVWLGAPVPAGSLANHVLVTCVHWCCWPAPGWKSIWNSAVPNAAAGRAAVKPTPLHSRAANPEQ